MGEAGKTLPKPLLRLGAAPLAGHVLGRLAAAGVRRVAVNVHHRAEAMRAWLQAGNAPAGLELLVSDESRRLLDTGGGVLRALQLLGADAALVHNCDSFWLGAGDCADLTRLARNWNASRMDALRLMQAGEYVGVQVAGRGLFAARRGGDAFPVQPLWQAAQERGRLHGLEADGAWLHVGTAAALARAERMLRNPGSAE